MKPERNPGVPSNPCSYKGAHLAHTWRAVGGYYEYWCRGRAEEVFPFFKKES